MASAYWATVIAVSATVSPLAADELSAEAMLITPPPSLCIAVSKERRVRVLGSKKRVAKIFPFSKFRAPFPFSSFSNPAATLMMASMSFLRKLIPVKNVFSF